MFDYSEFVPFGHPTAAFLLGTLAGVVGLAFIVAAAFNRRPTFKLFRRCVMFGAIVCALWAIVRVIWMDDMLFVIWFAPIREGGLELLLAA